MSNGEGTITADALLGDDGAFQEGWLDNLPEDTFEKDDTGKLKQGDLADHKNIGSMAKSYLNKDKLLGTAVQPLADDASDEDRRAHFTKLGCPEKVEGYEIKTPELPEGMQMDEALMKATTKYAHDNGIPKTIFEGLAKLVLDGQVNTHNQLVKAATEAQDKVAEASINKLKGEWGADYDKNLEMGRRAYDLFGGDDFVKLMEETGLKDNPVVVKAFVEIYKQIKPDEFITGGTPAEKTAVPGQLDYSKVVGHSGK